MRLLQLGTGGVVWEGGADLLGTAHLYYYWPLPHSSYTYVLLPLLTAQMADWGVGERGRLSLAARDCDLRCRQFTQGDSMLHSPGWSWSAPS